MGWGEATDPNGRVYYFNSETGESSWTKPDSAPARPAVSAPAAAALPAGNRDATAKISGSTSSTTNVAGSWRELTTQDGRKYYSNSVTNATMWEMPAEYREFVERNQGKGVLPLDRPKAEEQFMRILREAGAKSDWEWEEALRVIIDHPHYKCIPSLQERKELFQRFREIERVAERDQRTRAAMQAREAFRAMLENDTRIQASTRWSEAMDWLKDHPEFKAIPSPRDRVELFEEFISSLKRSNTVRRPPALDRFSELLRSVPEITGTTRWKEAIQLFSATEAYQQSPDLHKIDPIDMLLEFENHIKALDQEQHRLRVEAHKAQRTAERHARKAMHALIRGLVDTGRFTALTSWREFCELCGAEPCFEAMITAHPSDPTPLDLYWDTLDELQRAYLADRPAIMAAVSSEPPKDLCKFTDTVRQDAGFSTIKGLQHIELAFKELALRAQKPPVHTSSGKEVDRKLVEAYKHLVKHWKGPPEITLESRYEDFRPVLEKHAEFTALADEEVRRLYFDKYIQHLRKKLGADPGEPAKPAPRESDPEEGEVIEEDYSRHRSRRYY